MTNNEINAAIKSSAMDMVRSALPEGSIQVGSYTIAVPIEVDGTTRYATITFTAKSNKDTKVSKAFDPEKVREEWLEDCEIKRKKEEEKAAKKAAKIEKDKAARAAKAS